MIFVYQPKNRTKDKDIIFSYLTFVIVIGCFSYIIVNDAKKEKFEKEEEMRQKWLEQNLVVCMLYCVFMVYSVIIIPFSLYPVVAGYKYKLL